MQRAVKDLLAGLAFIAFGLAFAGQALTYDLGSPLRMGPGFFPLLLGGLLILLGAIVMIEGFLDPDETPIGAIPWRGLILLIAALLFFGTTVRRLGLAPAMFVAVFLAAFASRRTGIIGALLMAFGFTVFCILIFIKGLGVPLPLFAPWLGL